ncbi:aminotransferase class I/II-fold pyridoxal phosphate-dependent enzyme [Amaricoccus sp.]|uniref:pyridoxal phosphate-dependent aminotransferase n=1 Tax=Amaricoccus sp. TaxID=1872485 RepID=UPI001B5212DA|nr:aminotransferase class I/II-fold pyridoxal phosphate-dependent enzyme [Amaricoccus sp.]MBP7001105.1 aminotransferase class I/II-fold pyridoxal phosphate-dependent enzyme [Amaricoccus sp.]
MTRISRRGEVDPFIVMDVMEAARREEARGRSVIHMEVGQPGTPAPRAARAALARAMAAGPLGYTVALGLPELRARIARLYRDWYGIDLDPGRVVVTAGSSAGFVLAFTSLFDAGDRVAIAEPGYPSYRNILRALDVVPVGVPAHAGDRFQPTPASLPDGLAGLLVASPANPTGSMLDRAALAALIGAVRERGLAFVSDEIYHGIQYGARAVSALEIDDDVYVVNSFSKYFSMTGWRVGWLVVPETHVRRVERLAQNLFICPPHASQVTALAALDAVDELEANVGVYRANRALLVEGLGAAGFPRFAPPDGAFYIYADVSDLTDDSAALARRLLVEAGVAATPGLDFDPGRGRRTLRFSYAGPTADVAEGLRRLAAWSAG